MNPTPEPLTFNPANRVLSGPRGHVILDPGPALLMERMLSTPGKLVLRADLTAALDLPASVGDQADAVLRGHLKTARVLAAALTGGAWTLQMRGQEAAGLVGPAKPPMGGSRPRSW